MQYYTKGYLEEQEGFLFLRYLNRSRRLIYFFNKCYHNQFFIRTIKFFGSFRYAMETPKPIKNLVFLKTFNMFEVIFYNTPLVFVVFIVKRL